MQKSCEDDPIGAFIEEFIIDLKDPEVFVNTILQNLDSARTTYENNKSQTTLSNILNDLINCLEPKLNRDTTVLGESIGFTLIIIIIITAVFIFIIIAILVILRNNDSSLILIIIFLMLLTYITLCILIIYHYSLVISNEITATKNNVINCIHNTASDLIIFESTQNDAINKALCTYVESSPPIDLQLS